MSGVGSARTFDIPTNDFAIVTNDVTNAGYSTLAAAFLPALSGHQITGTQAAWRSISTLDTAGRSLMLWSDGDLRTPSTSIITLGGSSSLNVNLGDSIEIDGQARVSAGASADLYGDSFLLGSRGILTARTNSSLTINTPVSDLHGQTRLEQGASMTFGGAATAIGPTTASLYANLTAGGAFANIDTLTITSGTISAPLFWNRAAANIFGSTGVFGSYTNEVGAVTTIRSGTLFVFGSLTNNGTIVGTICSNCLGTPPNLDVGGGLTLGPAANLTMPFPGSMVHVGGSFDCAINSNTRYDMSLATLQLEGTGPEQTLEVMSTDIGPDPLGLDRTLAGHYPIGVLHVGPSLSTVRLVDAHDNDTLGQASCEAIYVDELRIDAGSHLINTTCRIYYNTLINNGTVDVPGNLVAIGTAPGCDSIDFNGDGLFPDTADIDDFLSVFSGGPCSTGTCGDIDFNNDGLFPDTLDIDSLLSVFSGGTCLL